MGIEVIQAEGSAAPIGPYSQGIKAGGFVFVAGEKGIDSRTGQLVPGGIAPETRQTLENIKGILAAAGCSMQDVVATTVYLTDIDDFQAMNQVYAQYFSVNPPGRTTVAVAALPAGAHIEIQSVALARS